MIDLRSDTVTVPTPDMRRAMAEARVGDDVYGEDPTVNELQEYAAELLGKEAALFVPTGVMSNQIAIALHTRRGDEVIVESESHIFHYETAAPAMLSGVQLNCVPSSSGEPDIENLQMAIRPGDYYFPRTALICLENTHNRHGGSVLSLEYIRQVSNIARMNFIMTFPILPSPHPAARTAARIRKSLTHGKNKVPRKKRTSRPVEAGQMYPRHGFRPLGRGRAVSGGNAGQRRGAGGFPCDLLHQQCGLGCRGLGRGAVGQQ